MKLFYDPQRVEQLRQRGIAPQPRGPVAEATMAIELVEECARLRAEVARLRADKQRLTDEVTRLRRASGPERR